MKKIFKRVAIIAGTFLAIILVVVTAEIATGHSMGLFSGSRPQDLGFKDGAFKPCSWKPNCVSSTSPKDDKHYIEPFKFSDDLSADWRKLRAHLETIKAAKIVREQPGYVHVEFTSDKLGFVDDVEFAIDHARSIIQIRSASRLGIRDFGVNRARMDAIRASVAGKAGK
jgi:uncharacterized protein (DUF1499 family)